MCKGTEGQSGATGPRGLGRNTSHELPADTDKGTTWLTQVYIKEFKIKFWAILVFHNLLEFEDYIARVALNSDVGRYVVDSHFDHRNATLCAKSWATNLDFEFRGVLYV